MVSYQCSPLSTAEGIISTFNQCQKMQHENDLEKFVSCVVLDEVGLAEDSPRLPLKALHPLLDDGTAGADDDVKKDDVKKDAVKKGDIKKDDVRKDGKRNIISYQEETVSCSVFLLYYSFRRLRT